ncbi:MAG: thioredoxin family protein [Lentisphaeria bacterium]|nr:thioredoxin family protein [Lentisphaeria bacterium]
MAVTEITPAQFAALTARKDHTVLVKFYADWCGPCRQFAPILSEFAAAHPEITVAEMNIETPENVPLVAELHIGTIPTVMLFRAGQPVKRISGFLSKRDLDGLGL